jgi:hypothetical protein
VWNLEKLPARGGILGSTSTQAFEGHSFETEEDLLVRETVQNAKDVPCGEKVKPKIVFRSVSLSGAEKREFLKAIELRELYGDKDLVDRTPKFSELRTIHKSDHPLRLTYVEDFNTTGLDGRRDDPRGNWMRFNLHGDAAKLEEEGKIGSYGQGKAVLARAAGTNTFLVYTAVAPTKGDPSKARLMGHTFQRWYEKDGVSKSGRGWWCESVTSHDDPIPFTDEEAHRRAVAAGFTPRRKGETGTSFLLIGANPGNRLITIKAIRHAIETWWWPSLLNNELDVELWEEGRRVDDPSPRLRIDLQPYIACRAKLDTGIGEASERTFQREHGKQLGRLALTVAADESIFDNPLHPKSPGPRRVARMRATSGMITEYKEFGTEKRVAFVGFFLADREIDEVLKFSEPAEHDKWSRVNQRLAGIKHGSELIKAIEDRTSAACYGFQRDNSEAREPLSERLPELESLLGAAFVERGEGTERRRKKDKARELRQTIVDFPDSASGRLTPVYGRTTNQLDFLIRYKLRPDADRRAKVRAVIKINVAQDARCERGEPLEVEVIDQSLKRPVFRGLDAKFNVDLSPGKSKTFRVKSAPYARHQVVLFEEQELRASE